MLELFDMDFETAALKISNSLETKEKIANTSNEVEVTKTNEMRELKDTRAEIEVTADALGLIKWR